MMMEHPFEDAFPDPNAEKGKELQAEIERRRYEDIMKTADGRWVMYSLLVRLGTFDPTFSERDAGAQAAGMSIRDTLRDVNLLHYHNMILENEK